MGIRVFAAAALCCLSASVWSASRTWKGTSGGGDGTTFADEKNWDPAGVPASGDTLTFGSAATLTDALDIGANGMTIVCNADVTVKGVVSGSGLFTKDGSGLLTLQAANTYAGGTLILNGELRANPAAAKLGTGEVEIRRASGKAPHFSCYRGVYANTFRITGPFASSQYELDMCQEATISGPIVCATAFNAWDHYQNGSGSILSGSVSAHGQTMYLRGRSLANGNFHLRGTYDCSFQKDASANTTYYTGSFTDIDATFKVYGGTNTLQSGAVIACTNVVVDNAGKKNTTLCVETASALSPNCTLALANGGKLHLPTALAITVRELTVNGTAVAAGVYDASSATLNGALTGAGSVIVTGRPSRKWIGGASGAWSSAANWSPVGVPVAGEIATVDTAVTFTAETVTIGAGELTINNSAAITCNIVFDGAGKLVKSGVGTLTFTTKSSYTGGTRLVNGETYTGNGKFTPGPYEIVRSAGTAPLLHGHTQSYSTKITVTGCDTTRRTITLDNNSSIWAGLESDGDVTIYNGYSYNSTGSTISGGVSAHGHTIYFTNADRHAYTLSGEFDASLDFAACRAQINMNASLVDPASTYTIRGGTNIVGAAAVLACGEVVVDNASKRDATLRMNAQGFRPGTALKLVSGGKVLVPASAFVLVDELYVDGVKQADGTYTAANLPAAVTGEGSLVVGGTLNAWLGGGTSTWSDPDCWYLNRAPASGETAYFAGTVEVKAEADPVDIGSSGLVICNASSVTIRTVFAGSGSLTKAGAGELSLTGASTFAGGSVITEGSVTVYNGSALGSGTVEVRRADGKTPMLYLQQFSALTNRVLVSGAYTPGETTISLGNNGSLLGPIEAEDDFVIKNLYTPSEIGSRISGGIAAHGHTVHLTAPMGYYATTTLAGEIDASVECSNKLVLRNFATLTDAGATYAVNGGSNFVYETAGTRIRTWSADNSAGYDAALILVDGPALPQDSALALTSGAKIEIPTGVRQRVQTFTADGAAYPVGRYTEKNLPQYLRGGGTLRVGMSGFMVIVDGSFASASDEPDATENATLFFAGDSTLDCHGGDESVYGSWGYNLRGYLKDGNQIDDRARSGYSTPTFRSDGLWGKLVGAVKTNDFVYIAFGHNDMSTSTDDPSRLRFHATIPEYQDDLRAMVDEVREKGGIPVIGTPIVRNTWSNGVLTDSANGRGETLRDYGLAAIAVAAEKGCDYVDMNAVTAAELTALGKSMSAMFFVANDGSHPCPLGARRFAALFLREVRRRKLALANLFK